MPNFNQFDREEYLKQLDQQNFEKQLDEKARLASLQKLSDQGLGQQSGGGYEGAPSLNKRKYGPYELTTLLEQSHSLNGDEEKKLGKVINSVQFLGGEHSLADAKKIAEELKWPGEKVDYDNITKRLLNLKPNEYSMHNLQNNLMEKSGGPALPPMWYKESPEEEQKRLNKFNKIKTSLK